MKFSSIPKELLNRVYKWKNVIENIKDFSGKSPPSIFVSSVSYPITNVGILAPPDSNKDTSILDFPEMWYKNNLNAFEIVELRSRLIYSRSKANVRSSSKIIDIMQELAPSKKPVELDIELKKSPRFKFAFDRFFRPIGNPAPISNVAIKENPKIERKVDHIISDTDLKAEEASLLLYRKGIPISRIQKIFSVGLLGYPTGRRLVPTRWSITAVDSILSENNIREIKNFETIDKPMLFRNSYLGNTFFILLIPDNWQYEVLESFMKNNRIIETWHDYEFYLPRKTYAENVAGGYYAARLGVTEYLVKIKRQASVFILRTIRSESSMPLGVWKVRETVRDAFNKKPVVFESLNEAIAFISFKSRIDQKIIFSKSMILKNVKKQKKIMNFLKIIQP